MNRMENHEEKIPREEVFHRLRCNGCRVTKQRETLVDIILQEQCSCCKEIYHKASQVMPEIGVATVYRTINALEAVGAIQRINPYRVCEL